MAAPTTENTAPVTADPKIARKKKAKTGSVAKASIPPVTPAEVPKDDSTAAEAESSEHPYLRELQKQIRNVNKKLSSTQKTDALVAQNPGVSLDELVAQRKINADQKASALKKPQLQAQLAQYEEQIEHYRKFDAEYQQKLLKQKEELTAAHQKELEKLRETQQVQATYTGIVALRQKLLTLSQFLRAAAHRRSLEEESETDENRAFEGILLLVYGGDQKAVDAAVKLIDGSEEHVPSVDGATLPYSYSQVKQASIEHAPYQAEEAWVDQVAEATGVDNLPAAGSDPTVANAGLTELNPAGQANGTFADGIHENVPTTLNSVGNVSGNRAGERWDTDAAGTVAGAEDGGLEGGYTIVPRPGEEVDIPVSASQLPGAPLRSTNWADDSLAQEVAVGGNALGEKWDIKTAGDQTDNGWNTAPSRADSAKPDGWSQAPADPASADDGFHEVPGRHRGRGRGRGDADFRGRGGRRGNFRGRGPRGEFRGRGGDGGGRGRGGPRVGAGNGSSQ